MVIKIKIKKNELKKIKSNECKFVLANDKNGMGIKIKLRKLLFKRNFNISFHNTQLIPKQRF